MRETSTLFFEKIDGPQSSLRRGTAKLKCVNTLLFYRDRMTAFVVIFRKLKAEWKRAFSRCTLLEKFLLILVKTTFK